MPPDVPAVPTDITVNATTNAAQLVAVRDGFDGDWKAATKNGDGSYKATVTGAYTVAVVCQPDAGTWLTWEHADLPNPKDPTTTSLTPPCDPATHTVTGTVTGIAPGDIITLGGGLVGIVDATGFTIDNVPAGTYDIGVITAAGVFSLSPHAAITVADADLTVATAVTAGTPLALKNTTFTPSNARKGLDPTNVEHFNVKTLLQTENSPSPMVLFSADPTPDSADTKTVNGKTLVSVPDGTTQQITMTATRFDETQDFDPDKNTGQFLTRVTNREFVDGDLTKIALPTGYGSVVWNTNPDPAGPSFISDSETADIQVATLTGTSGDGKVAVNVLEILADYGLDTNVSRFVIESDLPGYQAAWKLDLTKQYTRSVQSLLRLDDDETDPETHDNRAFSSTQEVNVPDNAP